MLFSAWVSFRAVAKTFRQWREEILAYFSDPVTNAFAEGIIICTAQEARPRRSSGAFQGVRERVLVACR